MNGAHKLGNAISSRAALEALDVSKPRTGEISSYHPEKHAVKVVIQPEGIEVSGWIPLGAVGIGNGFGVATAPNVGDMVQVAFSEGNRNAPRITGRFFSNVNMPPAIPAGDTWILHKSRSFMKFNGDGTVSLNSASDLIATVGGNATINVTGNVSITAKVAAVVASVSAAITSPAITLGASGQSLLQFVTSAFVALFNGHTHTSSNPGTPTSTPNQAMGSAHLTSTVQGG